MKYRILKNKGWYYPQYRKFLFWHNYHFFREIGMGEVYKTTVSMKSMLHAEEFILMRIEKDEQEKKKDRGRKVVAYF